MKKAKCRRSNLKMSFMISQLEVSVSIQTDEIIDIIVCEFLNNYFCCCCCLRYIHICSDIKHAISFNEHSNAVLYKG